VQNGVCEVQNGEQRKQGSGQARAPPQQ
jgi:hypothetical protein